MVKMVSMKKTGADRAADKRAMGETATGPLQNSEDRDGPTVHLEHHHLKNMGMSDLKSGDKISMQGEGHVDSYESRSSGDGDKMRATVRFHKMGAEMKSPRGDEDERAGLKSDIQKAHAQSERGKDTGAEKGDESAGRGGKTFTDKK